MFGVYRVLLALMVLIGHLHGPFQLGSYAVFGFYVLSGYLMTWVMKNSYGYHSNGVQRFIINRILRIYPSYYVSAMISLICLLIFGHLITEFEPNISFPTTTTEILQNLFIVFPRSATVRLSPPSWALTVELFFYICIGLGISKSKRVTWFWFTGSLLLTAYLLLSKSSWEDRYFPIWAASLPFSIGGIIYYHNEDLYKTLRKIGTTNPMICVCLMCFNFLICYVLEMKTGLALIFSFGFYTNLLLVSACLITLIHYEPKFITKKSDSFIGDFSYPIYLIHWQVGAMIFAVSGQSLKIEFLSIKGILFLVLSLLSAVVFSYLMIILVARPIERIRSKVKQS